MTTFHIGIDTGGTYTDAVIVDIHNHEVLAVAKSLTTKGKLDVGVTNALCKVIATAQDQVNTSQISLVSLSTTLATNALVEGKGSTVAVVLIGFSDDMVVRSQLRQAIPSAVIIRVDGGHEYDGNETLPLDEKDLRDKIAAVQDSVEAFSVAATYSIRNPGHEHRAKEIITEMTAKPVTASSELSDGLNGPLRALTATFNVRIVALIINLIQSVRNAMQEQNIDAPLMIVKGDGSIATAESIIDKPIETILSGPAASVIGANFISSLNDFIIADVGGTTTDVAIVRDGWPSLNEEGAMAGGYRTLVKAIDMRTIGLGGDSEVDIDHKGIIGLKSNRVVPVSLLCARFPAVIETLTHSLNKGMGLARAIRFIFTSEGFDRENLPANLTEGDLNFFDSIGDEPRIYDETIIRAEDRARAERLLSRGLLQVSGLTPSDAAHALDLQSQWSNEGARLACLMLGRSYGLMSQKDANIDFEVQQFARRIFDAMVGKSAHCVINQLTGHEFPVSDPLIQAVTHGNNLLNDLSVSLRPTIPLVAVGGPAQVFYGEVGNRLSAQTVIPQHADVANAVGAAIGRIKILTSVEITSSEAGVYHIHHHDEPLSFTDSATALAQASHIAREFVEQKALSMGGGSPEIDINIERIDLPDMNEDQSLIAATVTAQCLSTPST